MYDRLRIQVHVTSAANATTDATTLSASPEVGSVVDAWIYVYQREIPLSPIMDGDWRRHAMEHSIR